MSLLAQWAPLDLDFTFEAITSRERMWHRRTYIVRVCDEANPGVFGLGECGLFRGLSADDTPDYETHLGQWCSTPTLWRQCTLPSIRFGLETALTDLAAGGRRCWSSGRSWLEGKCGIPINGLIWMGDRRTMAQRIDAKLEEGYKVLKLKIGGINFEDEVELLQSLRGRYAPADLEIRLDANGSFRPEAAPAALERLAAFGIHSIEQPIAAGQPEAMRRLCRTSPVPIALDEELIGWRSPAQAASLLAELRPQYVILKPTLIGGIEAAEAYVDCCRQLGIGWWATSALESNIGLNAIAQWIASLMQNSELPPQGLGTGRLYSNNIESPLSVYDGRLWNDPAAPWPSMPLLQWR